MEFTGADLLVQTAVDHGIDHCFANPGTTELHLVQALDRSTAIRSVLCAFEGVCSGAADGYARMTGRPALGLFHLGPGYANALANLHNARRHNTPMVNVIGDQASWHLAVDAPLTSDIDALSGWTGRTFRTNSASDLGRATADAIASAERGPDRISNLIVPADHAWSPVSQTPDGWVDQRSDGPSPSARPNPDVVGAANEALRRPGGMLILGGALISEQTLRLAATIQSQTGCSVVATRAGRLEVGLGIPFFEDLPYFPAPLATALRDVSAAVITGKGEPVTFFGYPDTASQALPSETERIHLGELNDDLEPLLGALADSLGPDPSQASSHPAAGGVQRRSLPLVDPGVLSPRNLGQAFVRAIPEDGIVVAESISSGGGYRSLASQAPPHTLLSVTGGAIGGGLPAAVGAAVACPDRPVLSLQADGSALYTIQSLWTMAREALDVTVVICANRRYQILDIELEAAGIELSAAGTGLTQLDNPAVSFSQVAAGFGVPSVTVNTGAELEVALSRARTEPGPNLIEAIL